MLEPTLVQNEMVHLQRHFRVSATWPAQTTASNRVPQDKRDYVVRRLREMGFAIKYVPDSTFYLYVLHHFSPPCLDSEFGK
jgi:hypothetical protein